MVQILALDQQISLWLNGLTHHNPWLDWLFRLMAVGFVYAIPLILIFVWSFGPREKIVAIRVTTFGLIGWLVINNLIGQLWYRSRPFIRVTGTKELIFHQPDKSFPSDHATLGFALAIGFWLAGYKKLGGFLLVWTIIFSIARVVVGVHFPIDVAAGLIVGGIVATVGHSLHRPFDRHVGKLLVEVAKYLRLA